MYRTVRFPSGEKTGSCMADRLTETFDSVVNTCQADF